MLLFFVVIKLFALALLNTGIRPTTYLLLKFHFINYASLVIQD